MKKFALILWAFLLPTIALAQGPQRLCYTSDGQNCIQAVAAYKSIVISTSAETTAQLIALDTGKSIYVTSFNISFAGTGTLKFVYGTGTNCGTGTTDLTGAYTQVANNFIASGNGLGAILIVPKGNALCITTTGAVLKAGSLSYAQF